MKNKNVLLFYKKSTYDLYFIQHENVFQPRSQLLKERMSILRQAHETHYQTVKQTEQLLKKYHIRYAKRQRGTKSDLTEFDLILALGGDGTFLEAARRAPGSLIVGINSVPEYSVGSFCSITPKSAEDFFKKLSSGHYEEKTSP